MTIAQKKMALCQKQRYDFSDLVQIVEILRSEEGCPWDREQDHKSMRKGFIEETYEVVEAIDKEDETLLCEELGDVLLQVVFHAEIEREKEGFCIDDVSDGICAKLIHRHPHVFADVMADSSDKVLANWEKIKNEEKSRNTVTEKLRSVPQMLPALMRAEKVGKRASCFDFPSTQAVMAKVKEEMEELEEAILAQKSEQIEEEMGDLLLSITSLCRKLHVDPELSLRSATDKFIDRFAAIEAEVNAAGKHVEELDVATLDAIWDKNKTK